MSQSEPIFCEPHGVHTRRWPVPSPSQRVERFAYFEVKRAEPETTASQSTADRLRCPSTWSKTTLHLSDSASLKTLPRSDPGRQPAWHSRPSTAQSVCSNSSLPSIPRNVARYQFHSRSSKASWATNSTWESNSDAASFIKNPVSHAPSFCDANKRWSPRISADSSRPSSLSSVQSSRHHHPFSARSTGEAKGADQYRRQRFTKEPAKPLDRGYGDGDSYPERHAWRFPSFSSATVTDGGELEKSGGNLTRQRPDWEERPRWSILLNAVAFILCAIGVIIAVAFLAQYISRSIQGRK